MINGLLRLINSRHNRSTWKIKITKLGVSTNWQYMNTYKASGRWKSLNIQNPFRILPRIKLRLGVVWNCQVLIETISYDQLGKDSKATASISQKEQVLTLLIPIKAMFLILPALISLPKTMMM